MAAEHQQAPWGGNMKTPWGIKIRQYRAEKQLTREDLAQKIDVSPKQITHYENGTVPNIPLAKLLILCKLLGITPNDLLL